MEKILTQVTEQLGETDLSPKSIEDIVSAFVVDDMTEEQQTEAITKSVSIAKSLQGQINHSIATKLKGVVTPPSKQVAKTTEKEGITPEVAAKLEKLDKLDGILDFVNEAKAAKMQAHKEKEIVAAAKRIGVKDEDFCVEAMGLITISEETDVEKTAAKILQAYTKLKVSKTRTPGSTGASGDNLNSWKETFKTLKPTE